MTAEAQFFLSVARMRETIAQYRGDPLALNALRSELTDDDVRREFYKELSGAEWRSTRSAWVTTLLAEGFFDNPPPPVTTDEGTRYPTWPASHYLLAVSADAAPEVVRAFSSLSTDNPSIIGDAIRAALEMPAGCAADLVPMFVDAANADNLWVYFKDAADLCKFLAASSHAESALPLVEALFNPKRLKSSTNEYWYREGLRSVAPIMAGREPQRFLSQLCGWLQTVMSQRHATAGNSDYSYIWRPAIEEHEQNRAHDLASVFVGIVRRSFVAAIEEGTLTPEAALIILRRYDSLVFRRLALYLTSCFGHTIPAVVRATILNRELLGDFEQKHEYAALVKAQFSLLTDSEQGEWLSWVDAGPILADDSTQPASGHDQVTKDAEAQTAYWQFERLHWIRDYLKGPRKELYSTMKDYFGEPEMADLNFRRLAYPVQQSPLAASELPQSALGDAVKALSGESEKGNAHGTLSTFREYLSADPARFSTQAADLLDQPAHYAIIFIDCMADQAKAGAQIQVLSVLDLCDWAVDPKRSHQADERDIDPLIERTYQSVQDSVLRFAQAVCVARKDGKPVFTLDVRDRLWKLIAYLEGGSEPQPTGLPEGDVRLTDYLQFAINTSRGKSTQVCLDYAHWVAAQNEGRDSEITGRIDSVPEVRTVLEREINASRGCVEALSVIGSRFGLLYWLDRDWTTSIVERLFPLEPADSVNLEPQHWAAWNSFVTWVPQTVQYLEALRPQYSQAVAHAGRVMPDSSGRDTPMDRLGEQLMVFYGRGNLTLDSEDSLVGEFLLRANSKIRRHAIGFVGMTLTADVPDLVVNRFQDLWDAYWSGHGPADISEDPSAMLFGSWFASGTFPREWAIDRLGKFVTVCGIPEPDDLVVTQLAKYAPEDVDAAVRVLDRVVREDETGWRTSAWLGSARDILELAVRSNDKTRDLAVGLIDHLGRRGFTDFGDLLT